MLLRGAYAAQARMLAGEWPRNDLMGQELAGKTMGLVGLGAIARLVKQKALALGMAVAAHDPYVPNGDPAWDGVKQLPLDALLATADVLSLHVPLTDGTRDLVDGAALAKMKPTGILINAARGGVVDEAALAQALRDGRLGGAALDVFATEPLTAEAARVFDAAPNLDLDPAHRGRDPGEQRARLRADRAQGAGSARSLTGPAAGNGAPANQGCVNGPCGVPRTCSLPGSSSRGSHAA